MAIYQFVIELIPEFWVMINKDSAINSLFVNNEYDSSITWQERPVKLKFEPLLTSIFPQGKSWDDDLMVWGDDEHSDIQVWLENDNVDSIKIRLDLRDDIEDLKMKIVDLARQLGCYFLFPDLKKIEEPDITALNEAILNSSAKKFVNDPEKFLNESDS